MFFPLSRGDAATLVGLIAFSLVGLLVDWGDRSIGGVAALAWWMAALMLLSPAVAIVRLLRARGDQR